MGVIPKKIIKKPTAYHEAGHAVASWLQGIEIEEASIMPDEKEGTLGCVSTDIIPDCIYEDFETGYTLRAEERVRKEVIVLFAGHEAERLVSGRISKVSWESDRNKAYELMSRVTGDKILYVSHSHHEITCLWLKLLRVQARAVVNSHKDLISALAKHLLKCKRMTGTEVGEFLLRETASQRGL